MAYTVACLDAPAKQARSSGKGPCTLAPRFVLRQCVCSGKNVRYMFSMLAITIALVILTVVMFLTTVKQVKTWVNAKHQLKRDVRRLAARAAKVMNAAHKSQMAEDDADDSSIDENVQGAVGDGRKTDKQNGNQSQAIHGVAYGAIRYDQLEALGAMPSRPKPEQRRRQNSGPRPSKWKGGPNDDAKQRTSYGRKQRAFMFDLATTNDSVMQLLDDIESVSLGHDGRGFMFAIDTSGGVWAHGKTRHLARGVGGRVPGFHSLSAGVANRANAPPRSVLGKGRRGTSGASANDREHASPTALLSSDLQAPTLSAVAADIVSTARCGGGYASFRWKRNTLMVAYVCPVKGTDLILVGALPVPKRHLLWERSQSAKRVARENHKALA